MVAAMSRADERAPERKPARMRSTSPPWRASTRVGSTRRRQLITHGIDIDACANERPHRDAVDAVENAEQKMFRSHIFAERLRMALGSKHHFTGV
jgi:hypothetical protein